MARSAAASAGSRASVRATRRPRRSSPCTAMGFLPLNRPQRRPLEEHRDANRAEGRPAWGRLKKLT
jgi:hypothetical protein